MGLSSDASLAGTFVQLLSEILFFWHDFMLPVY